MKKPDLYTAIFWIVLGMFLSVYAYTKLGIGKLHEPGPGLMPFILGLLFSLLALFAMAGILRGKEQQNISKKEESNQEGAIYKRVILVVVAMFVYALLLEPLGFILTTLLTMTLLFRSAGFGRWIVAATYSGVVVLVTYFLFTFLGVRFPPGVFRALGLY
ncbi:MAG: tripartite tricarboxylate transporter TctB family protein [Deltaproteobacteria bacterium]|nr:tripartite tricarboxylate transporter TctB family protein [Deltaproteobacteria bacterium]